MYCQNCGQMSAPGSQFCRACGTKFPAQQQPNANNYETLQYPAPMNYENTPPRPYSWKTDEFSVQDDKSAKSKPINRVQPLSPFQTQPNAAVQPYQQAAAVSHNFRCPRCSSQQYPRVSRQISTAGWITFAVLLVTFFPLFWIGLLIKEDVRVCPVCSFKYH